ncbi:MAG TPA: DoxX family protein, partial [Thermoanaerobaculia bacterium]
MTTPYFPAHTATRLMTDSRQRWAGRILSALPVLFLVMDATMKLLQVPVAVQGTMRLGYPVGMIVPLGIIE